MKVKQCLFCTGLAVALISYVVFLIRWKYNHATALGDKRSIPNCEVLLETGLYSNETI
jgi:hypothetical protein